MWPSGGLLGERRRPGACRRRGRSETAAPLDWERDQPPAPDALADAVEAIVERHADYRSAARARAVARFGLEEWIERHRRVFEDLAR